MGPRGGAAVLGRRERREGAVGGALSCWGRQRRMLGEEGGAAVEGEEQGEAQGGRHHNRLHHRRGYDERGDGDDRLLSSGEVTEDARVGSLAAQDPRLGPPSQTRELQPRSAAGLLGHPPKQALGGR